MDFMNAIETIRADLSGLQALAVMFTDAFATDKATMLQNIELRPEVFVNAAWLISDLIGRICKDMDAAINAGTV